MLLSNDKVKTTHFRWLCVNSLCINPQPKIANGTFTFVPIYRIVSLIVSFSVLFSSRSWVFFFFLIFWTNTERSSLRISLLARIFRLLLAFDVFGLLLWRGFLIGALLLYLREITCHGSRLFFANYVQNLSLSIFLSKFSSEWKAKIIT